MGQVPAGSRRQEDDGQGVQEDGGEGAARELGLRRPAAEALRVAADRAVLLPRGGEVQHPDGHSLSAEGRLPAEERRRHRRHHQGRRCGLGGHGERRKQRVDIRARGQRPGRPAAEARGCHRAARPHQEQQGPVPPGHRGPHRLRRGRRGGRPCHRFRHRARGGEGGRLQPPGGCYYDSPCQRPRRELPADDQGGRGRRQRQQEPAGRAVLHRPRRPCHQGRPPCAVEVGGRRQHEAAGHRGGRPRDSDAWDRGGGRRACQLPHQEGGQRRRRRC
mmetsp:Transcript_42240/g.109979  ORF Transcript_42240/g.109979 Transcript_42240/m.109979 type:complete len:275 (+) Transcript_42240:338-1162(+)